MKLKSFECPDTGLSYEYVELAEAYIAKNEDGDVFVMSESEVQEMVSEGQIAFDEDNIISEGDKKKMESDDEDVDGDDDEDKEGTPDDEEVDESKDKKYESDDEEEMEEMKHDDKEMDESDEDEEMEESLELDFDVTLSEDDKKALFDNGLISEEYADTAKTIFESAIKEQVVALTEQVKEHYSNIVDKRVEKIEESLKTDINNYLEYVISEWFTENEIAIESGLKSEMNEKFIESLAGVYAEHFVQVPDERYDILEGLADKVENLEASLNEQLETNSNQLQENKSLQIELETVKLVEGLSSNQAEKFQSLLENVSYSDVEEFKTKANQLKESYFKSNGAGPASSNDDVEIDDAFQSVNESPKTLSWIERASQI